MVHFNFTLMVILLMMMLAMTVRMAQDKIWVVKTTPKSEPIFCSLVPKVPKLWRPLGSRYSRPLKHGGSCARMLGDTLEFSLMPAKLTVGGKIGPKQ